MYQKSKDCAQAPGADATWYLHCMSSLAQALRSKFEALQTAPQEVLAWFAPTSAELFCWLNTALDIYRILAAYTTIILDSSDVKLLRIGKTDFGVSAKRDFEPGEYIYELMGIMPIDSITLHSKLSVITPHPTHGQKSQWLAITGPLHLLKHRCQLFNAQVSSDIYFLTVIYLAIVCCCRAHTCICSTSCLHNPERGGNTGGLR